MLEINHIPDFYAFPSAVEFGDIDGIAGSGEGREHRGAKGIVDGTDMLVDKVEYGKGFEKVDGGEEGAFEEGSEKHYWGSMAWAARGDQIGEVSEH